MSKRRRILKFLALAFLTGIFLITTASVAIRLAFNPRRLEQEIRARILEVTGREAGLTQASVSLTRGIIIKGFYLLDPEPSDLESISFERAIINVGLFSLMRGNPEIRSIDLSQPHIDFICDPAGNSNLSDLLEALGGSRGDSQSDEVDEERSGGGGSSSRSGEPEIIEYLRVRGGSISVIRQSIEEQFDHYLDITGVDLEITGFNTEVPFPIRAVGSLGAERQTTFTISGILDPKTLSFDGDLDIVEVRYELANSLLDFVRDAQGWRVQGGDLQSLRLAIRTGPGFDPVEIEGEMEADEIEVGIGGPTIRLTGDVELTGSMAYHDGELIISKFRLDSDRRGPDGEFQLDGHLNWKEGVGELNLGLAGISPSNFSRFFPLPVRVSDPDTWIDLNATLSLEHAFERGRFSGILSARQLSVAVPGLSRNQMDLAGLSVEGAMTYDLASEEFGFEQTVWSLPGLISPEDPIAVVGSSHTGLGVVIPALRWSDVMERVSPASLPPAGSDQLANLARLLGVGGDGIPLRVAIPAIDGSEWRWQDIESSFRAEIGGLVVENFQADIPGGHVQLTGALGESGRVGHASVEGMGVDQFASLCGVEFPDLTSGMVTGDVGGDIADGEINMAALAIDIDDLGIKSDWMLDELAVFTGVESLRQWNGATGRVLAARNGDGWRIGDLSLRRDSMRFGMMGFIGLDDDVHLLATLTVPPGTVQRFSADPLFANAPAGSDGWSAIEILIEGTRSRPSLRGANAEDRDRVLSSLNAARAIEIFNQLGMTPPDEFDAMVVEETVESLSAPEVERPTAPAPPLQAPVDAVQLPPIAPLTQPEALSNEPQLPTMSGRETVSPENEPQLPPAPIPSERAPEIED